MIDEERFCYSETFQPSFGDGFYGVWAANYAPEHEAYSLLEEVGLGPDEDGFADCGLIFTNNSAGESFPGVFCSDTRSISLLQAELTARRAAIEIRFEERSFPIDNAREILRDGGNYTGM
ncbi:hypothetical protein ACS0VU_15105 [Aliiroseovarius sp. KMU-71]|uniref:hypothetical protein n=1 Tax=Aliiroseovarius sp. KMU-71 TaxID=3453123 RepID=UPI003F47D038